jgi:putative sigma-54 modulation protein
MQLQVKGKNLEVPEQLRSYAEQKVRKLERRLHDLTRVELELAVEKNPSIADNHVAEATIWAKSQVLRAREASADPRAAIDQLVEKLERQVRRYADGKHPGPDRNNGRMDEPAPTRADGPVIVKSKQFVYDPMTPEQAVDALEVVGHDFFVFRNSETSDVNVVYRRRDGTYGLIEPS